MSLINAETAHRMAEFNRRPFEAWEVLSNLILKRVKDGQFMLVFDEEKENARFKEDRKEVKKELEKLGYSVSYSRVRDSDDWHGETYHNCYVIEW